MTTSHHCSFRTFWLGYCDWFASRTAMTHKEALTEIRQQHGSLFPSRLLGAGIIIVCLLLALAVVAPLAVTRSVAAGVTSHGVAQAAQWGCVLAISAFAGSFAVGRAVRLRRFCLAMCERGRAIEVARATACLPK
jgi:hypothetical protein